MNIGIILPNWIGDVVMATPTLRAIRLHFGAQARISGVLRPYVVPVLEGADWLDEQVLYDPRHSDRRYHSLAVASQLRRRRIDTLLLLTNSLRTGAIGWLSGARRRIGYARGGRGALLTDRLRAPRNGRHFAPIPAIDYYLAIARAAGCEQLSRQMQLSTLPRDDQLAEQVWSTLKLDSKRFTVLFNTGGAKGAAKDWPTEYFIQLAQHIISTYDASILVLCGPQERATAENIERAVGDPRVTSMADPRVLSFVNDQSGLGVAKALVRRSDLMVTTDSGPRHFAHAFDVPVITLYGPNDPRWTEPYHPRSLHLIEDVPCGPCARRTCPLAHHRCMRELAVDRVSSAVQDLMQAHVLPRAA